MVEEETSRRLKYTSAWLWPKEGAQRGAQSTLTNFSFPQKWNLGGARRKSNLGTRKYDLIVYGYKNNKHDLTALPFILIWKRQSWFLELWAEDITPSLSTLEWATAVTAPISAESCALTTCKSMELTFLHLVTKSSALRGAWAQHEVGALNGKAKGSLCSLCFSATNERADMEKFKPATDMTSA